ncbi:MAG: DUF3791 domain-containing protein [Firmicutes bacterium]|nr:DUF3791 domain-containing protein [Bacillota bacterium]
MLLEKKYARIIVSLAERKDISVNEAMKIFYESTVYQMLSSGIADLHCRSDYYIVDEILIEIEDIKQQKERFINRMLAYENALEKIRQ